MEDSLLHIYPTNDGSLSLHHASLDETYHSRLGAYKESMHVFVKEGFQRWLTKNEKNEISIFELGFGTGLNAILTCHESLQLRSQVNYHGIEKFPVPNKLLNALNYKVLPIANKEIPELVNAAPWNIWTKLTPNFSLFKQQGDMLEEQISGPFDLVYFDAFAPSKQPALWTYDILKKLINQMKTNAMLVSYSAMGQFKRDLKSLGLEVINPPGALGKREMTVAIKH